MPKKLSPIVVLKKSIPGLSARNLAAFTARASYSVGLKGAITVLITSSHETRRLNERFRGKSYATDVLSFPPLASVKDFCGDIAISLDIAARNAQLLGHSVAEEIKILVLHGILHLAGYDHESDNGQMAKKESRLRQELSLPPSLIERTAPGRTEKRKAVRLRT